MKLIWFRHMAILAPLAAILFSFYIHLVTCLNPRTQGTNPLLRDSSYDIIHQLEKMVDFLYSFPIQQQRSTFEMLKSIASQS
jgi:hypothetical protein